MVIKYFKLKAEIAGHPIDTMVRIHCDNKGIATEYFWRRRIDESKYDNSMEILKKKPKGPVVNAWQS